MQHQKKIRFITLFFVLGLCVLLGIEGVNASPDKKPGAKEEEVRTPNSLQRVTEYVNIEASWPTFGVKQVDEEINALVDTTVKNFEKAALEEAKESNEMKKTDPDAFTPRFPYDCLITFDRTAPLADKSRVKSIVWNISTYTGGAHGSVELLAQNFDMKNGTPLILDDIFTDPQNALLILSRVSRQVLSEGVLEDFRNPEGDDGFIDEMLRAGTEPQPENFVVFCLIPNGLRVYFPPYQVAPYAAGVQSVDITLDALQNAKPRMEYWQAL